MLPPPCECCEEGCVLFSDGYATDQLATAYDDRAGTWTVGSGELSTTSASALLVGNEVLSGNAVFHKVQFKLTSTSSAARIIIAYTDDNNYWFGEMQPGASNGTFKLFQRSGGTNTQRGLTHTATGFQVNEWWTARLCYANGFVTLSGETNTSGQFAAVTFAATVTINGTQCGVGTGANTSAAFDGYSTETHRAENDDCQACTYCEYCTDGLEPYELQVEITGLTTQTGCAGPDVCSQIDGVYVCTRGMSCQWYYGFPTAICGYVGVFVFRSATFGQGLEVALAKTPFSNVGAIRFILLHASVPADCLTWSALNIPFSTQVLQECSGASATVTVTSL